MLFLHGTRGFFVTSRLFQANRLILEGQGFSLHAAPPHTFNCILTTVQGFFPSQPLYIKDTSRGSYIWGNHSYVKSLDKSEDTLKLELKTLSDAYSPDFDFSAVALEIEGALTPESKAAIYLDKAIDAFEAENFQEALCLSATALDRYAKDIELEVTQGLLSILSQVLHDQSMHPELETLAVYVLSSLNALEDIEANALGAVVATYADYVLVQKQSPADAIELYEIAAELMDDSEEAEVTKAILCVDKAIALTQLSRTMEAEEMLTQCKELIDEDDDAYYDLISQLGKVTLMNGNLAGAAEALGKLEKYIQGTNDQLPFDFYMIQAEYFMKMGLLDKAQHNLSIVNSTYTDLDEGKRLSVQLALIGLQHSKGKLAQAKQMLGEIEVASPELEAEKLYHSAYIELDYGHYELALVLIEQGMSLLSFTPHKQSALPPLVVKFVVLRANLLVCCDAIEEARKLLVGLLKDLEAEEEVRRLEVAQVHLALSQVCKDNAELEKEAICFLNSAYSQSRKGLGLLHSFMFECIETRLDLLVKDGYLDEAVEAALRILKAKIDALGPTHPYLLNNIVVLARICKLKGKPAAMDALIAHGRWLILTNELAPGHVGVRRLEALMT
jgi:tetratricopeptide (TPR) repeat protein